MTKYTRIHGKSLIDSQSPYYWVYSGKRSAITIKTNKCSYRVNLCPCDMGDLF